jgi:DNA-binding HxlR family transcriptional regulator
MKRASLEHDPCPVARALDAIGDWWSLLILRDAFDGIRRFGHFQDSLGVAKNILTVRLRKLVADGILETVPASDGSRHQEYALTEKGNGLFHVMVALRQWGEDYLYLKNEPHAVLIDRKKKQPVRRLELYSKDGRLLHPEDTAVRRPAD